MISANIDFQDFSARLDRLEKQNRRWKLTAIAMGLSSASLLLIAAKPADHVDSSTLRARSVEAQDFILKDEDGQIRARLSLRPHSKKLGQNLFANPTGSTSSLEFYDENGDAVWTAPQSPTMIPTR